MKTQFFSVQFSSFNLLSVQVLYDFSLTYLNNLTS